MWVFKSGRLILTSVTLSKTLPTTSFRICRLHTSRILAAGSPSQLIYDSNNPRLNYVKVASHGCVYNVGYLDEGPSEGATVLVVHGSPGGATDFDPITESLTTKGVRVIAPNLPGNPITKVVEGRTTCDMSTSHRAQFLVNFMNELNINSIDIAVGHSLGGTPVIELAATTALFKGLALLNAVGHTIHKQVKPYWLIQLYAHGLEHPRTKHVLKRYAIYRFKKLGFKVDDVDHFVTGAITQARLEFPKVKYHTEVIQKKNLPVLFAFCQNDRLLEWVIPLESALLAGTPPNHISYFDADEHLVSGPPTDEVLSKRAIVFATGGHHALRHHTDKVSSCLLALINHVSPHND